jgi:hypothetical protein
MRPVHPGRGALRGIVAQAMPGEPRLPDDFSVEDIVRAGRPETPPPPRVAPADEARGALWEMDFAIQQLGWFERTGVRAPMLARSVANQLLTTARNVERFPVAWLPLPDDLRHELGERFARLSDALSGLPDEWADHAEIVAAHERLRARLEERGVDVD